MQHMDTNTKAVRKIARNSLENFVCCILEYTVSLLLDVSVKQIHIYFRFYIYVLNRIIRLEPSLFLQSYIYIYIYILPTDEMYFVFCVSLVLDWQLNLNAKFPVHSSAACTIQVFCNSSLHMSWLHWFLHDFRNRCPTVLSKMSSHTKF
jgi:hypothetical protein